MVARCPACKWELPIFGKRPLKNATFSCPRCEADLIFRTRSLTIKSVSFPVLFVLLGVIRANDGKESGYLMIGLALTLIMFVVWLALESFEMAAEPTGSGSSPSD